MLERNVAVIGLCLMAMTAILLIAVDGFPKRSGSSDVCGGHNCAAICSVRP